jgi:hypothetical protein
MFGLAMPKAKNHVQFKELAGFSDFSKKRSCNTLGKRVRVSDCTGAEF